MRGTLAAAVRSFLTELPTEPPGVPISLQTRLVHLADFVTRCRSGVVRDGHRRELEYAPEPEMPARFVKQLFELLRGVALVLGHQEATSEDMDRVARAALDSIPAVRRVVLRAVATLPRVDDSLKTTQVSQAVQYASATVRRALEDLQALGILEVTKGGPGKPDAWHPREEWHQALDTLQTVERLTTERAQATFSEKSDPPSHTHITEEKLSVRTSDGETAQTVDPSSVCQECGNILADVQQVCFRCRTPRRLA
jgi:DeoR-like helix-turn-helix domain